MHKLPLASLQQQLINYLVDDDPSVTDKIMEQITEHGNITRDVRLHIYKNAYQARLKETIDNDHQMLGFFLGDDLFDQMVSGYINALSIGQYFTSTFRRQFTQRFWQVQRRFMITRIISELAHL